MDARDADTIVGDNGRIIRIVGINRTDAAARQPAALSASPPSPTAPNYVQFDYDTYGDAAAAQRLIVRGVHLLDYTVGGPDYLPQNFGHRVGCRLQRLADAADLLGHPEHGCRSLAQHRVHRQRARRPAAATRSTARPATTPSTAAPTTTSIYGDAQNDDLIGGWGNDWISGGTGSDGILGDDGRIFTSRNTGCPGAASSTVCAQFAEPLYGILALRTVDPDTKTSQGDVLNEFIYTPGQVQTATHQRRRASS